MIPYDKDIVRAIGHVAIYSAYLEDELQELIITIKRFIQIKNNIEKFRLSSQAENLIKILKKKFEIFSAYSAHDKNRILNVLKAIKEVADERNRILHLPIISEKGGQTI